jgi:two-component system osmolarity sensor histidine kinase EnvZ
MAEASPWRVIAPLAARTGRGLMALLAPLGRLVAHLFGYLFAPVKRLFDPPARALARIMPKGLYPRAMVIVIAPVVLLQSVIAYVFMERHWQTVTQRLSSSVSSEIAALIDVYESYPQDKEGNVLGRIAEERLGMDVEILPDADLPPPGPAPSSRCSTTRFRPSSASRSSARSGSTRSAAPA